MKIMPGIYWCRQPLSMDAAKYLQIPTEDYERYKLMLVLKYGSLKKAIVIYYDNINMTWSDVDKKILFDWEVENARYTIK